MYSYITAVTEQEHKFKFNSIKTIKCLLMAFVNIFVKKS